VKNFGSQKRNRKRWIFIGKTNSNAREEKDAPVLLAF